MAINRYLNPNLFEYRSQFVPQEIPWDLLQSNMQNKQKERDSFLDSTYKLGDIAPAGEEYTVDHFGNSVRVGDYSQSVGEVQKFQQELDSFSKDFSNTELNRDSYSKYADLQKKYNQIKLTNDFRQKRAESLKMLQEQRIKDKVNAGDARGFWAQKELERMMSDPNYIPVTQAHQDIFDETKFVKELTSVINPEVLGLSASQYNGYIDEYKKTGRTPEKVKAAFEGAFYANQELQQKIQMEAEQLAYQYGVNDPNAQIQYVDGRGNQKTGTVLEAVTQQNYDTMLSHALGTVSSEATLTKKADSTWQYKDKLKRDEVLATPNIVTDKVALDNMSLIDAGQTWMTKYRTAHKKHALNITQNLLKQASMYTTDKNGNPVVKEGFSDELNSLKAEEMQLRTQEANYNAIEEKTFKTIKATGLPDIIPVGLDRKAVEKAWNSSSTKEEFEAKLQTLNNKDPRTGEGIIDKLIDNLDFEIAKEAASIIKSPEGQADFVQLAYGTGTAKNKQTFADIKNMFQLGSYSGEATYEDGKPASNTIELDEAAGYNLFTDPITGMISIKVKEATKDLFGMKIPGKTVVIKLDDRNTIGKKLLNQAYIDSQSMYESTGDNTYKTLADQTRIMIAQNSESMISSFDNKKLQELTNDWNRFEVGESRVYSVPIPDKPNIYQLITVEKQGNENFKIKVDVNGNNILLDPRLVKEKREHFNSAEDLMLYLDKLGK